MRPRLSSCLGVNTSAKPAARIHCRPLGRCPAHLSCDHRAEICSWPLREVYHTGRCRCCSGISDPGKQLQPPVAAAALTKIGVVLYFLGHENLLRHHSSDYDPMQMDEWVIASAQDRANRLWLDRHTSPLRKGVITSAGSVRRHIFPTSTIVSRHFAYLPRCRMIDIVIKIDTRIAVQLKGSTGL
jgi:hypothetical protein